MSASVCWTLVKVLNEPADDHASIHIRTKHMYGSTGMADRCDSRCVEDQCEQAHKVVCNVFIEGGDLESDVIELFFREEDIPREQGCCTQEHKDHVHNPKPAEQEQGWEVKM